jgi:hypothetical protein
MAQTLRESRRRNELEAPKGAVLVVRLYGRRYVDHRLIRLAALKLLESYVTIG